LGLCPALTVQAPFRPDIEVPSIFLWAPDRIQRTRFIAEWELETLAKEVLMQAPEAIAYGKSLRDGAYLSGAVNKLKSLEQGIHKQYGSCVATMLTVVS
jgi:hypothetical protein